MTKRIRGRKKRFLTEEIMRKSILTFPNTFKKTTLKKELCFMHRSFSIGGIFYESPSIISATTKLQPSGPTTAECFVWGGTL